MTDATFNTVTQSVSLKELIQRAGYVVVSAVMNVIDDIRLAHAQAETRRQLRRLPPALLRDIGVEPHFVEDFVRYTRL